MDTTSLLIQFALNPERQVESETSTAVQSSLKFTDALREILAERPWLPYPSTFSLERIEVYVNRTPSNPFFLIAASPQQLDNYNESLNNPQHAPILAADLNLTVAEVVAKYKIAAFTLYLKTPLLRE